MWDCFEIENFFIFESTESTKQTMGLHFPEDRIPQI